MDGRIAAGVAAGVAGLGIAAGAHVVMRGAAERSSVAAEREWDAWEAELDAAFPKAGDGDVRRPLAGDADQQRFEQFLIDHPKPTWVHVKHRDLRSISIEPREPNPRGFEINALVAGGVALGGGLASGVAGGLLLERAGQAGSTLGTSLSAFGAVLGLATIGGLFLLPGDEALVSRISAGEWHR